MKLTANGGCPDYCAYMGSQKSRLYNHALRLQLEMLGLLAPLLDWIY